ncbi:MAG: hypothetical protein JSW28_02310, partial [Thermoplasmata archaeon]
ATMTGMDPFTRTIIISSDASYLHYYFALRDAAGNWFKGPQVDIGVGGVAADDTAPTLVSDNSDTQATTGDAFEFEATFSDDTGVTGMHVVYWFGTGTPINATMADTGTYTITIPSDSLDTLHYYFTATDAGGNWYVGTQVNVNVADNDAPYNLADDSDTQAATGDTFTFNASAEDNIGVTSAEVVYWFDSGVQTTAAMTGTDPFTYSITIPSNAGVLHYYYVFYDAATNSKTGQQRDIQISDNDPGSISNDASDSSGTEGEAFQFQVDASDNTGVDQVFAVYWIGDDESKKKFVPLSSADGITFTGSTIPEEGGTLHYYFRVVDDSGNTFDGTENTAPIEAVEISPEEVTEKEEADLFPWILVVILIVVILLLLFLMMRKKEKEPEAVAAEPGEGLEEEGEVGGEVGGEEPEEGEPGEELGEGLEGEPEAEEAIGEGVVEEEPDEELKPEDELEEGGPAEDLLGEDELIEEAPGEEIESEEQPIEEPVEDEGPAEEGENEGEEEPSEDEGAAEEGGAEGEETGAEQTGERVCPNCGIASSADTEECPICRTKLG